MRVSNFLLGFVALSLSVLPAAAAGGPAAHPAFARANSLAGHGSYKQAVEEYKTALAAQPNNPRIHHMYGRTLALMGLLQNAVDEYRVALKLTPKPDSELENDIGVALAAVGSDDLPEAAIHLKKAVTLNTKFIAAYNNLGVALSRLGDYRAARDVFAQSLKMQPTNKSIEKKMADMNSKLAQSKHFDYTMAKKEPPKPAVDATATTAPTTETPPTAVAAPVEPVKTVEQPVKAAEPVKVAEPVKTVVQPAKVAEPVKTVVQPAKRVEPVKTVVKPTPKPAVEAASTKPPVDTAPPVAVSPKSTGNVMPTTTSAPVAGISTNMDGVSTKVEGVTTKLDETPVSPTATTTTTTVKTTTTTSDATLNSSTTNTTTTEGTSTTSGGTSSGGDTTTTTEGAATTTTITTTTTPDTPQSTDPGAAGTPEKTPADVTTQTEPEPEPPAPTDSK